MIDENKNTKVQVESKSGIQPEITDLSKITEINDKKQDQSNASNKISLKNDDTNKLLGKKIERNNGEQEANVFVDITHFLEEDRYSENYEARKAFLSKINMAQNINGLSGDLENIKSYFEKIVNDCPFNEYYNGDAIKESTYTYQFSYDKVNKYFSNIRLSYLNDDRLIDSYTRITNIALRPDNSSWRPNFMNFVLTNIPSDVDWKSKLRDATLDDLEPDQYSETKVSVNDTVVMNAWNQMQLHISTARDIVAAAAYGDFTVTGKVKTAGDNSAPIYNIDIKYKIIGSYATPTPQYAQASVLNKQFLQPNEMYKNTRMPDSLVCNGLDYRAIQLLFGRTENVNVNYTNKTNLMKLVLYLMMYNDESDEYFRNFNSNNLHQTIAEKVDYHLLNNNRNNYYKRTGFSVTWISWDQYFKKKMGLEQINIDDSEIYYVPCHRLEFEDNTYLLFTLLSILPYPLITKHIYMYLVYAYRLGHVDSVKKLSYSGYPRMADYIYNYININGFTKICFVVMDLPKGQDDPTARNYYKPVFNLFGFANRQVLNLYNNDIVDDGYTQITFGDMQNVTINQNFRTSYFGNFKNYIINIKKWELDGGIFEFCSLLTSILKCNYQNMTYHKPTEPYFGDETINVYNFDNPTWPFSLNGLLYTTASAIQSKTMSYAYYSNFNSLLCEYLGLIKLQRPRVSFSIQTVEELIDMIYLIRLKASIGMNDLIKYKRIPTMPDNTTLPTSSGVTGAVLDNIYKYVKKRNKIDQEFISIAGKYNNNFIDRESNFYTIYKPNVTQTSLLPNMFLDHYDNYLYCTSEKWIKEYFNCNDVVDTSIKDCRTLNVNNFVNKFIDFKKLTNVLATDSVHYGLYSSVDYYKKEIEREINDSLTKYISNCYSIHFRNDNDDQLNPGIFKIRKMLVNSRDYLYSYINLPVINITPFTCLTDLAKKFWILSTNDTDYQLIFSDILFNNYNYIENYIYAFILKCDTVAIFMPRFISCRLQNNNQVVTIDAPQVADPNDFRDDDE